MCDSLLCQVDLLHYSCLLVPDTRIIIKEESLSSLHWFAQKFARSISKLWLKSTSCFYFSIEIFWQKNGRPFNFIASRTLKYSLRSTFRFQTLCGRQDSWHLCMLLLFRCYSAFRCVLQAISQYHQIIRLLACTQVRACPERQRSSMSECKMTVLISWGVPFGTTLSELGPILYNVAKLFLKMLLNKTEKAAKWHWIGFPFISCKHINICLCVCFCWLICVFMWVSSCVGVGA